jgi:hypothetical protein
MQGRRPEGRKPEGRKAAAFLPFCLSALTCLTALSLAACTHASAKATPDMPGLQVPAPPPRDVEPSDVEAPAPVPLAIEPARNAPPRRNPSTPAPRPAEPRTEPPKPEPPTPIIEPPKPAEEAPRPPTTLQTTPAMAEGEVERGIRASLQRAAADLNRVDYRHLNADARTQYDTAKRFVRQADDAIATKNLVYAKNLAEKAATIAAQLAGR